MLLPGAKMQISFIKDLATVRDPQSKFTFLNYLKEHGRLLQFTNLGTFLPTRLEFNDYMTWAARHFTESIKYGEDVVGICPYRTDGNKKWNGFQVESKNVRSGERTYHFARHVVIAVGGKPSIPSPFPNDVERIMHSSEYAKRISKVLPVRDKAYNIAVVGSGQSAAEIFNDLHGRFPSATTSLVIRDSALRPSDDSPFVNEIFDPAAVDEFYNKGPNARDQRIHRDKSTNYSVVRLELLEKMYADLYQQSIKQPDQALQQHKILACRGVVDVVDMPCDKKVTLTLEDLDDTAVKGRETLTFDAVILATGYTRNSHLGMLKECQVLNGGSEHWQVQRDYSLNLEDVEDDAGIWLQGCNEQTHGLSDSLLSILATRSGDLVDSIFKRNTRRKEE